MTRRAPAPAIWALCLIVGGTPRTVLADDDREPEAPEEDAPSEEEAPPEDVVEEEVPTDGGGLALTQPPPAGKGAIAGVVTDTKYKEPVIDAVVQVVGTKIAVLTDVDGTYRLELPPGRYVLQIVYELHKPVRTSEVALVAGQIARVDATVEPEEGSEDVVETVIEVEQASVEGLILQRQKAAAAGDSIGRAEITKSNDRTAAEAARRVVGANIEGARFLFVRGIGERYTNALLDGFPLPSPEPDRQAVPLDLFPSQILESLTIVKTFTPDVPGDFAGGSVRIATRRIPNDLTIAGGVSMGFNTVTTFQEMIAYDGGDLDWLGIDDGTRALPEEIPGTLVQRGVTKESGELISRDEITRFGRAMNTGLTTRTTTAPPNHGGNFVVSSSWAVGSDVRIGVMGALLYDRRFERREDEIVRTFGLAVPGDTRPGPPGLANLNDLRAERGVDKVNWGALAGVTAEIDGEHTFGVTGLHTRSADIEARELFGFHDERQNSIQDTRISFVSRSLTFGELTGKHVIDEARGFGIAWGVGVALATRDEPDTRGTVFIPDDAFGFSFEDDSYSAFHLHTEQSEKTYSGQLDLTQPLGSEERPIDVKLGGAISVRDREFSARRFRFRPIDGSDPAAGYCGSFTWERNCPDRLFSDDRIGGGPLPQGGLGPPYFELEENTRDTDGYTASLNVFAGYLMFDGEVVDTLRVVVGPRLEVSQQSLSSFSPVDPDVEPQRTELDDPVLLPAVGVIYSPITKANLRASLTRTVARPQLRELAPFSYSDYFGGNEVRGNPDLENTTIVNADTRFEFFPTSREVVAVSAFYKRFESPIEQVVLPAGARGIVTYQNGTGGNLFGVEFEARKSFDVFTPVLRPLSLIANVTFTHSRVDLDPETAAFVTSQSRPLSFQAPYIANVSLDFDGEAWGTRARVNYNLVGPRLAQVGTEGMPDFYDQARHSLDVTVGQRIGRHIELRASVTNLLDWPVTRTAGFEEVGERDDRNESNVVNQYRTGQTVSLGVGLNY